ncbi:MAG: MFS transporter [Chloroflexi bacterium]|nr:MFS transporter [Chloroflexota bacterium]
MRSYWILFAVIFLNFTGGGAMMPFFSLYATNLGASLGSIALIVGLQAGVGMVASLYWGQLADRIGRRKPFILVGAGGIALSVFAIANVPHWLWLIPLHGLIGVASGANQATSLALMGDILHDHPNRGRYVSAYRMSGSLAFSVSIVMSGWMSENIGIRGSFQYAAIVYTLSFLVAIFVAEPPPLSRSPRATGFREVLAGPMRPLLILALSFGIPFSAVYSVWPVWVAEIQGHGRATFSQLWGIAAFVEVPCMLLAGIIGDRIGRRPMFVFGLAGFAVVYLIYLSEPPLTGLIAAQVLRGFVFASFTASALTMAVELAPAEARGRASALYTSAQQLGQISGNWVGGPIADLFGFRTLFAMGAALVLVGAAYTQMTLGRVRRAAPASSS